MKNLDTKGCRGLWDAAWSFPGLLSPTIWVIHQQHKGKNSNQYLKIPNLQLPESFDEDLRLPKPG